MIPKLALDVAFVVLTLAGGFIHAHGRRLEPGHPVCADGAGVLRQIEAAKPAILARLRH